MQLLTLGAFIQGEIKRREMSIRQFADFVGVTHPVIAKFRYHGIKPKHGGRHIGDPSLDFLAKLSKATHVDLCALVGLIHPEVVQIDAERQILIDQILNNVLSMTPGEVDKTATYIIGTLAQRIDKGGDQKQLPSGKE
jgi:hypothetical protein